MRLCYLVSLFLLSLAPLYYTREYAHLYTNETENETEGYSYKSDETDIDPYKSNVPAIWRPASDYGFVEEIGVALYKPRPRRFFDFIMDAFKKVVSVTRIAMDILSPIFTIAKFTGLIGGLLSLPIFPPLGITVLSVTIGFSLLHAGVTVTDLALNQGKPHPSLGKTGEFFDNIATGATMADMAMSFFDLTSPGKFVSSISKMHSKGIKILNSVHKLPQLIKGSVGFKGFISTMKGFLTGGGRKFFTAILNKLDDGLKHIKGFDGFKDFIGGIKKGNDGIEGLGKGGKALQSAIEAAKKAAKVDDIRGAYKAMQHIVKGVGTVEDAKTFLKAFSELRKAIQNTVQGVQSILGLVDLVSGGSVDTKDVRKVLGLIGDVAKLMGGKTGTGKGINILKTISKKGKSREGLLEMLDSAEKFAKNALSAKNFKKTMTDLSKVDTWDDAKKLLNGVGAPKKMVNSLDDFKKCFGAMSKLADNTVSINGIRRITKDFYDLSDSFSTVDGLTALLDETLEVVDNAVDSTSLSEAFEEIATIKEVFPNLPDLSFVVGELKDLSSKMPLDDVMSTAEKITQSSDSLEDIRNTVDSFKEVADKATDIDDAKQRFSIMADILNAAEDEADALPTLISTLMDAENSFGDTKSILEMFERVASSVQDIGGFKTVVEAMRDLGAAGSSEFQIKRKSQAISDILTTAPSGTQQIMNVFGTLPTKVNSVEKLPPIYNTLATATDYSITREDLLHVFGMLKESKGIRSSAELVESLNQLGIFSDSMVSLQHFKEFAQQVSLSAGHIKSVDDLQNMLKMTDLFSDKATNTTGLAAGTTTLSDISDCVKSIDDIGPVLNSIGMLSKGVQGAANLHKIFDTLRSMASFFKTTAGFDIVMQHLVDTVKTSKSLKEMGSVYGTMEDRLTKKSSQKNLDTVFADLKLPKDSLISEPAVLNVAKGLQALVSNVYRQEEAMNMADALKIFPAVAQDIPKLATLAGKMKTISATSSDSVPDMMRAFAELPKGVTSLQGVRPALQVFEKLAMVSKDNNHLRKNAKALGAVASRAKTFNELNTLLGFMNDFSARSQSMDHLKQVLNYLGTVPPEVKSKDQARKMINAVSDLVDKCETKECLETSTDLLKTANENIEDPNDVRKLFEMYEMIGDRAPNKKALQDVLDETAEMAACYDDNEAFYNNMDYIEGFTKQQLVRPSKNLDLKHVSKALKKVDTFKGPGTYEERVKPLFKDEFDAELPGVKTKEDVDKYIDVLNNFPKKEESLTDMEDCLLAFDRLNPDEKVMEFLRLGELFKNTPSILGGIGSLIPGLGSFGLPSLSKIPPLVKKVKAEPNARQQLKQLPQFIPPIQQLPGGVPGLSSVLNPLGALGGALTGGIKSLMGPRPKIVSQLQSEPGAKSKLSDLIGGLDPISKVAGGAGLDALGQFKKAVPAKSKDIVGGVADLMGGISSFNPLSGLSSIASSILPLPHGSKTLSKLGGVMKSMGSVPDALSSIKQFPVAMRMPGCAPEGLENIRKVRSLMGDLGVEKDKLDALDALKKIGDQYHGLPNGQQDLEDFADVLNPLAQLPRGPHLVEGVGKVLDDLGQDGPDLTSLVPDLEAIKKAVGKTPILQEMVDQLDNLDDNFDDLVDLAKKHNGWPALVDWLKKLLDEAEATTTPNPAVPLPGSQIGKSTVDSGIPAQPTKTPGGIGSNPIPTPQGSKTTADSAAPGATTQLPGGGPGGQPGPGGATRSPGAPGATTQKPGQGGVDPNDPTATKDPGSSGDQTTTPNLLGGPGGATTTKDSLGGPGDPGGQATTKDSPSGPGGAATTTKDSLSGPDGPGGQATTTDPLSGVGDPGAQATTANSLGGPGGQQTTKDPSGSPGGATTQGSPINPGNVTPAGQGSKTTAASGAVSPGANPTVIPPQPTFPPLPTTGELDHVINLMIQLHIIPVTITRVQRDEIWQNFRVIKDHKTVEQHLLTVLPKFVEFGGIPKLQKLAEVMEPFKDTTVLPELANVIKSLPQGKTSEFLEKMKKVLGWMGGDQEKIDIISEMGGLLGGLGQLTGGIGSIAKILPSSLGAMAKLPEGFGSLMDKVSANGLIKQMPDGSSDLKKLIGMMEHMDKGGNGKDLIGKLGKQFMKLTGFPEGLDIFGTISDMMGMFTGDKEANGFVDVFKSFTGLAKGLTGGFDPISGLFDFLGGGLGSLDPGGLISSIGSLLPTGALTDGISAISSFKDVLGNIGGIFSGNPLSMLGSLTGTLGNLGSLGGVFNGIGGLFGAAQSVGGMLGIGGSGGAAGGAAASGGGLGSLLGGLGGLMKLGGLAGSTGGLMGTLSSLAPLALAFGKRKRSTDPRGALNFLAGTSEMLNALAVPDPAFSGTWPLTWPKPEWRPPVHHWRMFVEGHVTMQDALDHLNCVLTGCTNAATLPGFVLPPLNQIPLPALPPPPVLPLVTSTGSSLATTDQNSSNNPNQFSPNISMALKLVQGFSCADAQDNFQCSALCLALSLKSDDSYYKKINTILLITSGVMFFITFVISVFSCCQKMSSKKEKKGRRLESDEDVEMAFETTKGSFDSENTTSSRSKNSKESGSKEKGKKKGKKADKKPKTDSKTKTKSKTKSKSKSKESDQKKAKKPKKSKIPKTANKPKRETPKKPKKKVTGAGMTPI